MDDVMVSLHFIDFGMLTISCPGCNEDAYAIYAGLITAEDDEEGENPLTEEGLPNLVQKGVVAYPCGDVFASPCMTDKVARILNALENYELRLSMFMNLIECKEHGVEFPNQS